MYWAVITITTLYIFSIFYRGRGGEWFRIPNDTRRNVLGSDNNHHCRFWWHGSVVRVWKDLRKFLHVLCCSDYDNPLVGNHTSVRSLLYPEVWQEDLLMYPLSYIMTSNIRYTMSSRPLTPNTCIRIICIWRQWSRLKKPWPCLGHARDSRNHI